MDINKQSKIAFIMSAVLLVIFLLSAILHNFVSAVIGHNESIFFIGAIVAILILPLAVLYALIVLIASSFKISPKAKKEKPIS